MQETVKFDQYKEITVKRENLKGLLLHFNPIKDDGVGGDLLCDIADLNKVDLGIYLKRGNREIKIFDAYLEDLLLGLFSQTTKLALSKKKTSEGYLMKIELTDTGINLQGNDELLLKFKAQKTAFTGTVVSRSNISIQTIPSDRGAVGNKIPQVRVIPIGTGEIQKDFDLGNGVRKVVVATDYTSAYDASAKAKIVSGSLRGSGGYEKIFNGPLLYSENMHYLDLNPESDVEDLVAYWGRALNGSKLAVKFDQAVDEFAKIIVLAETQA